MVVCLVEKFLLIFPTEFTLLEFDITLILTKLTARLFK
ncbi:hypothetical protein D082_16200 [Synechocystis sp. PCC 6714]|nr:hypothetical protein D082_16200 [Synechocystis sp. PCC 6714]